MERNALIYASAPHAIVIQPRFLHGGTWHGSTDALKRGLSRVWVHGEPGDQAVVKLCEMGAKPIHTAEDLAEILALPDEVRQPLLFDEN
jgi:predicted Rossmann fold nucleotide-binding protein DprA/Smf involved in DNA uptake